MAKPPSGTPRGRKSIWGERSAVSISWPVAHRRRYERAAEACGLSLTEYVIRFMGASHGLIDAELLPEEPDDGQLQLPA